jgi:hypothetical protein
VANARLALLSFVPVLACAPEPRAEIRRSVDVVARRATTVDAVALPGAPADAAVESSAAVSVRCAPLVWTESACISERERPEPMSPELFAQWYADRGAQAPTEGFSPQCREVRVGPSAEAALACERMTQPYEKALGTDVFRVVLSYVIVAVRKGRAVTLFDRGYYVEVLDKEVLERGPLFALDVDLSESGQEVVVRELAPDACASAKALLREEERAAAGDPDEAARASRLAWTRFDEKILARTCANVGRYTWSAGAFVKAR